MKRRCLLAGVGSLLVGGCATFDRPDTDSPHTEFVRSDDWPTVGYDRARTGVSPQSEPIELSTTRRWTVDLGSEIRATPLVRDGRVYVHDRGAGRMAAINERTGEKLWTRTVGGRNHLATPALDDDRIYLNSNGDWTVRALDAESGETEWTASTSAGSRSIACDDGMVIVGPNSEGGTLIGLEAADGAERWTVDVGTEVFSAPAIVDGIVYAGSTNGDVLAVDIDDGSERWRTNVEAGVVASPVVRHGSVYVSTQGGVVRALDRTNGDNQWSGRVDGMGYPTPAVDDDLLVAGTWIGGDVRAFDPRTGRERWRVPDLEPTYVTSPVIAGDRVYFGSDDGVHAVDRDTGDRITDLNGDANGGMQSSPSIVNDTVYIGDHEGTVHAISKTE